MNTSDLYWAILKRWCFFTGARDDKGKGKFACFVIRLVLSALIRTRLYKATIAELAEQEKMAPSYMTRVLRLTLLSPDIVEAILDGTQGPEVTLAKMLEPFPLEWGGQRTSFDRLT